ncbi:poly(R)-hydroxyalkanoic acid synthase subunit PhaE [Sporosarcina pasteurii]|uniref:Polyhydroxyalkanoic acid synthase, PhaR subunit n=1 Tax=Sporosarcina pasteurii TaxID=1474 RepID=A0A380C1F5_SPOPA|nr:poly(R)-hydroxyalkanoic acid synthase subunit PhaE [Sporosarcina pasteurii]MDS9471444.1 polyhydroxyalkanoate biosynthesis repressor PhaR [Sporosarcina pasteurii]QBQ04933.1 polyhydroxyalkanoate biosynthesis repressor PhaR [Sporosarcina pasteurii]SUJ10018.1 polyhydroxyalkanoic acid synthase, PhaR subunit [Sporosarcina pasteurii]
MSQTLPIDPFKIWKDIYDKTENAWNDAIQESLGKESFSEGLGQTLNSYLQYQEFITKTAESYLTQFNMPSRDEVANVASLVINTENKIDNLEDQLEELVEENKKEINSLKRTISNLDKKLDRILAEVEKNEKTGTPAKKK